MYFDLKMRRPNFANGTLWKGKGTRKQRRIPFSTKLCLILVTTILPWWFHRLSKFYSIQVNPKIESIENEINFRKRPENARHNEKQNEVKRPYAQAKILEGPETLSSKKSIIADLTKSTPKKLGSKYTSPEILAYGCSITIVLMEPRLATETAGTWTAFESAVSNIHPDVKSTTCLYLQTSSCDVAGDLQRLYDGIYQNARPQTKQLIDRGNARVAVLDFAKYRLKSCQNFYNPSNAWMNINYWTDEFISEDSDHVLLLQRDAVMCHSFNPNLWRDVAYVGAVWPPRANMHNNAEPAEGMCKYLKKKWDESVKEDKPFPSDICDNGKAPLGNGGFSLRSRQWMIKAIEYCPHPIISAVSAHDLDQAKCVFSGKNPAEDVYFAIVLNGIGAPMPLGFEAALFSAEMMMPETVLQYYSTPSNGERGEEELEEIAKRRWGEDAIDDFRRMRKGGGIIPIGFHKPYWYFNITMLLGDLMSSECQFLVNSIPFERRQVEFYERQSHTMKPEKLQKIREFFSQWHNRV